MKWQPKIRELYYYIDDMGYVGSHLYLPNHYKTDAIRIVFGNAFKTREQAQQIVNKFKLR